MDDALKVGALAKRTGLTVRTLHHYDEIGLLTPQRRTRAGHRLYGQQELRRLQQIASLKRLGLSLDDIRECLERPEYSLENVLTLQIQRIDEELSRRQRLRRVLESLRDRVRRGEKTSMDELADAVEATLNYDRYFTPQQLESIAARRDEVGDEEMRRAQTEWSELFTAFADAMDRGVSPDTDEVLVLARRAKALIEAFTGGDPGIAASLSNMYREEGPERIMSRHGMNLAPGLWEYMAKAREALAERG